MSRGLAVVTGGSRGLGRELALALAREGYDLRVCARDKNALRTLQQEAAALGVDCQVIALDLDSNRTNPFAIMLGIQKVDILVNNVGISHPLKLMEDTTSAEVYSIMRVNFYTPLLMMHTVVPEMKNRGKGVIVNICSMAGRRAIKNQSLYCASKFALRGLTEAVAQELEGTGVKCFSVSPGGIRTQMRQNLLGDASQQQDPAAVAQIIVDAIAGRISVPQGGDLVIRGGEYTAVARESWVGITRELDQAVPV